MNPGPARSLPELVTESVSAHFREHGEEMADSIRTKVEDVQLHLLDGFFKTIQGNYAQRITALEEITRLNNETLDEIQGSSARTEEDLRRLSDGIRGLIGGPVTIEPAA
jgi:hypothetical protein